MVSTITRQRPPIIHENGRSDGGSGGSRPFDRGPEAWRDSGQIGLLVFMASVTMLFAGIYSSLLIRRASSDWTPIYLPKLLWLNTAVLIASSVTLEFSRRAAKGSQIFAVRFWITVTAFLGLGFLAGQLTAWRDMALHGVFMPVSPHASFFYLLTGLHGIHLLGGVIVLVLASLRAWSGIPLERQESFLKLSAVYWHYLDALWVVLFITIAKS